MKFQMTVTPIAIALAIFISIPPKSTSTLNSLVHEQCTTKTKYKECEFDAFVTAVAGIIEYKAIAEIERNDVGKHESEDVRDLVVHLHFKQEQECVLDAC